MSEEAFGSRAASSGTDAPEPWSWIAWAACFVSYVILGYVTKSIVLNWIVGPLYPLFFLYLIPKGFRRITGRDEPFEPTGSAGVA